MTRAPLPAMLALPDPCHVIDDYAIWLRVCAARFIVLARRYAGREMGR